MNNENEEFSEYNENINSGAYAPENENKETKEQAAESCQTVNNTKQSAYEAQPPMYGSQSQVYNTQQPMYSTQPVYQMRQPLYTQQSAYAAQPPMYAAQPPMYPEQVQTPKQKKKKGLALKIIAACLACLIVGGAVGAGISIFTGKDKNSAEIKTEEKSQLTENVDVAPPKEEVREPQTNVNVNIGASAATAPDVFKTYTGDDLSATEIYELGSKSVVGISTKVLTTNIFGQATQAAVSGSGFVISKDGYILTNYHVVEDSSGTIEVKLFNGESYEAVVVGHEEDNDIAVLKIDAVNLSPVVLGSSEDMRVGDMVYAIGNPLGELTYTMTHGMISALDREIATADNVSINMFQVDVAINSGNSGGPIFNSRGEVIGIVTAKYADTGVEGLGFAIPIDDAVYIAKEVITYGYVTGKPSFGITVATITQQTAAYYNVVPGVYVQAVNDGSCSEKAGIQTGDIITKLGDTEVISSAELTAAKKNYKAGDRVEVTVYRNGEYITLTVVFDEEVPEQEQPAAEPGNEPRTDTQQVPDTYGGYSINPFDIFGDIFGGYGSYGGWNPYGNSAYKN